MNIIWEIVIGVYFAINTWITGLLYDELNSVQAERPYKKEPVFFWFFMFFMLLFAGLLILLRIIFFSKKSKK